MNIDQKVDKFALGGPTLNESNAAIVGSVITYRTATLDRAKAPIADDAHTKAGMFNSCTW